jgi:hypothetical protein
MAANRKALCILLIVLVLLCAPAQAQLKSYLDERGNLVFVNETPRILLTASKDPGVTPVASPGVPLTSTSKNMARLTTPQEIDRLVQRTAEKHRVDPRLVRAVIATESNWNSTAVSPKGALGLMQLIPETAQQLGVADAFDPAQNVDAGVRYLAMLLDRYNGDLERALAAYNAGPGAVDRSGGIPRYRETRNYVQKVTSAYFGGSGLQPGAVARPIPIYRAVEADGRVVYRNE